MSTKLPWTLPAQRLSQWIQDISARPRWIPCWETQSYAHKKLGWKPIVSFEDLVKEMVEADLTAAKRDQLVKKHGYDAYDYHE